MRKVAWLAAIAGVAASTAAAAPAANPSAAATVPALTAEAPCQAGQPPDPGCNSRIVNPGSLTSEPGSLASPASAPVGWTPLHAPHSTGLGFLDAASQTDPLPPAKPDEGSSHPVALALLALGALLVLLRKRPA